MEGPRTHYWYTLLVKYLSTLSVCSHLVFLDNFAMDHTVSKFTCQNKTGDSPHNFPRKRLCGYVGYLTLFLVLCWNESDALEKHGRNVAFMPLTFFRNSLIVQKLLDMLNGKVVFFYFQHPVFQKLRQFALTSYILFAVKSCWESQFSIILCELGIFCICRYLYPSVMDRCYWLAHVQ